MAKTPFSRRLKGATPLALILGLMSQASAQTAWQECSRADVKALKVFTVGEASLSRMNCDDTDPLSPPLKLEFAYFREVPGDAFAKAALHFLEKNRASCVVARPAPKPVRYPQTPFCLLQ